ncbi:MAG: hypothetical protein JSR59_12530 [Proteobacteria bacterium]|nr:hypothetical protein [Pseudomonadota bacterium]
MTILWPAFLVAGVLEMLVFAVVDPRELHWFGGPSIDWTVQAVYTVTFLIFWGAIATAGALSALLSIETDGPAVGKPGLRRWP